MLEDVLQQKEQSHGLWKWEAGGGGRLVRNSRGGIEDPRRV